MGDMADATMEWGEDEFYEERLIVEAYGDGMSPSAIAARYNISLSDVLGTLEWARSLDSYDRDGADGSADKHDIAEDR